MGQKRAPAECAKTAECNWVTLYAKTQINTGQINGTGLRTGHRAEASEIKFSFKFLYANGYGVH